MVDSDDTQPRGRRSGLRRLLSLAVAIGVGAVLSVLLFLQTTPEPASPVEVAKAFMGAWEAGDGPALATMFSSHGVFEDGVIEPDQLPRLHYWYRILGWTFQSKGCLQRPPTDRRQVHCFENSDHDLNQAFSQVHPRSNGGPLASTFVLIVEDGRIVSFRDFSFNRFGAGWEAFMDWVSAEYPADFALMYDTQREYPILDDLSLELWANHVDEFDPEEIDFYVVTARQICYQANLDFEASGHMILDEQNLVEIGAWAQAAAHYSRVAITQLRELTPPSWDRSWFEEALQAMDAQTEVLDRMAAAARDGDEALVDELGWMRVQLTHEKDGIIGQALWGCPINLPA